MVERFAGATKRDRTGTPKRTDVRESEVKMTNEQLKELKAGDKVRVFCAFSATPHTKDVFVRGVSKFAPNGDVSSTLWLAYNDENGNYRGSIAGEFVTEVISLAKDNGGADAAQKEVA